MNNHSINKAIRMTAVYRLLEDAKQANAELKRENMQLRNLLEMYGLQLNPPIIERVAEVHGSLVTVPGLKISNIKAKSYVYVQRYLGNLGYQLLIDDKSGQVPFTLTFSLNLIENYLFVDRHFGFNSVRQLITLINSFKEGKCTLHKSFIGQGTSGIYAVNVPNVMRVVNKVSKVNPKTYWFTDADVKALSDEHRRIFDQNVQMI